VVFLGVALPALLVVLALRRWFAPLPWSVVAIAFGLTIAFVPVLSKRVPVPVDEVMRGYPYRGVFGAVESRNALTNDTVKQILPWMQVAREELFALRLPLWNRHQFSGYPLLGNGQSAPWAPLFLATLFVPLPGQLVAMAGLKIFLALLFGWLFLRDEGVSATAALFGSAIFAFSVFQTVYLYYPMTTVTALLPAAAFALRGCVRFAERRWMVLLAIVTASVASGGHPESAVHVAIACAILLLLEWRNPARAIVAALFGVAIAAPAWVPVVEQALLSVRAMSLEATAHDAMNPLIAWTLLNPDGFGNPARGNWQWIYNYSIVASSYLGLLTLALLPSVRRRRDVLLLVACVLLFLVAMNWTVFGRALNAMPPLTLIAQDRLRFVIVFLAAIVAARVVDRPRWVLTLPVLAAGAWLLYAKWGVTLGWSSVGGVVAVIAFLIARKAWVAFLAVVVELFLFNAGFNVLTNRAHYKPSLPILEKLQELTRGEPVRIAGHDWTLLPNAASQYGFEDVRGHDPMALASYARFFENIAAEDPSSDVKRVQDADHPALAFLNVRFLIADPGFTASPLWLLRYAGPDGNLYERAEWRRRFFAPHGDARIGAITQRGPTRIDVEIDAPREAFIASSQVFAPGWRVSGATSILRLHDTFIGFRVAPGKRIVTLRYVPLSFYASCAVALVALYIGVHAIQVDRRRRAADAHRVRSGVHP
jgi:hypothetical protein